MFIQRCRTAFVSSKDFPPFGTFFVARVTFSFFLFSFIQIDHLRSLIFSLLFRFNRAHKSQDFMRTPSARRSRRSLRSGYAFAHQEGFGKLITSGKIMRKTGLNFGSKASSNNAANNNSGSLHNVSSGGGLASTSDQPDGKSSQKENNTVNFLRFVVVKTGSQLTNLIRSAKPISMFILIIWFAKLKRIGSSWLRLGKIVNWGLLAADCSGCYRMDSPILSRSRFRNLLSSDGRD